MRKFWQKHKGLMVLLGAALAVAAVLHAQPQGGAGGPRGDWQNRMAMGTVKSVQGNQIVVEGRDGQTRTVSVTSEATVTRYSRGTQADLKKDTMVRVMGQYDQNRAWFIPRVIQIGEGMEPRGRWGMLSGVGKVYSTKDNQVYLTLPLALSSETSIIRGDRIAANQVKPGERIFAMGEPGANNVVQAQRVVVGDEEAMRMGMGGGMGMMGGFRGPRGGPGRRPGGR